MQLKSPCFPVGKVGSDTDSIIEELNSKRP